MTQLTGTGQTREGASAVLGGFEAIGDDRVSSRFYALCGDVSVLCKWRVALLVVVTAYIGFAMGAGGGVVAVWPSLAVTLLGVALSCMGASALNQAYEYQTDALMGRTRGRPVAARRVSVGAAAGLGVGLCAAGVLTLGLGVNWLTAGLSAATVLIYAAAYTPMKRRSSLATVVGAVPGALPPVMGYTGAAGRLGVEAWLMFAVLFVWQMPHFLAIAWRYRDEYASAGIAVLPVVDPGGTSTLRQTLVWSLALVPVSLLPSVIGVCGDVYFFGTLLAGVVTVGFAAALLVGRTAGRARALFYATLVYLPAVFALMLADRGSGH